MNINRQPQDNRDSREIQQDIRETRGDMDRTLDSLNERLSPRSLMNGAMDWFDSRPSGGTSVAAEKAGDMLQLIRENPLPALLTGAGIAWLIAESKSSPSYGSASDRHYRPAENYSHNLRQSYGAGGIHTEAVRTSDGDGENSDESGLLDKAKGKLSDASSKIGDAMSRAKHGASDLGSSVSEYTSHGASAMHSGYSSVRDTASDISSRFADGVQENYRVVDRKFRQAVDEVPLGVGLGFLGLGVLTGLMLPRTKTEDDLMGDVSDDLKDAASDKGEELMERGKNVASRVADKAMEEADNQHLTPDAAKSTGKTLSAKIGSVVDAAKEEGKKAAQDEGLTSEQAKKEAAEAGKKITEEGRKRLDS